MIRIFASIIRLIWLKLKKFIFLIMKNWIGKSQIIPFLSLSLTVLMVTAYRTGFVGRAPAEPPFCARSLARRMIEEMGVDRYMTEILRVADQEGMSDAAFHAFCQARGMAPQAAQALTRGQADVTLTTGPHLGAFNDRTSLPELAECTAATAAACLVGRYFLDRGRN